MLVLLNGFSASAKLEAAHSPAPWQPLRSSGTSWTPTTAPRLSSPRAR